MQNRKRNHVVVYCEPETLRKQIAYFLSPSYRTTTCGNEDDLYYALKTELPDLLLMDSFIHGHDGLKTFLNIRPHFPHLSVVMLVSENVRYPMEAIKLGVDDFVVKPVNPEELDVTVRKTLSHTELKKEVKMLRALFLKSLYQQFVNSTTKMPLYMPKAPVQGISRKVS